MAVLDARLYKRVERMLYSYFALRNQVDEYAIRRVEILHGDRAAVERAGKGTSRRTDPTARKGAELAELDAKRANAAGWVKVINCTIERYRGTGKGQLLQLQYFEELGEEHIRNKLQIERTTYFCWRTELVMYTAMAAVECGLISLFT